MRERIFTLFTLLIVFSLCLVSCGNKTSNSGSETGSESDTRTDSDTVTYTVDATLSNGYMRGFDASMVSVLEEDGVKYCTSDGTVKDIFTILKNNGVNWIRIRVWVKPTGYPDYNKADGDNSTSRTVAIAKRVKSAGLNLLLDFHYSDYWADPGKQYCPSEWKNISSVSDMSAKIKEYTEAVLTELNNNSATPDMVQIGNEINTGILTSQCKSTDIQGDISGHTSNLVAYLNAGASAVRAKAPNAKIMIHMAEGGNSYLQTLYGKLTSVDYDVIGLSYYPFFTSHKTLNDLSSNISSLKSMYNKEVVIAETSFAWTCEYNDNTNNQLWYTGDDCSLVQAVTNLVSSDGSTIYTGVKTSSYRGKNIVTASVENQAQVVRAIMEVSAKAGATGIFYWGGDSVSGNHLESTMENQAFFDFDNKALSSLAVFGAAGK